MIDTSLLPSDIRKALDAIGDRARTGLHVPLDAVTRDHAVALQKLASLGATADDIALLLKEVGVRTRRGTVVRPSSLTKSMSRAAKRLRPWPATAVPNPSNTGLGNSAYDHPAPAAEPPASHSKPSQPEHTTAAGRSSILADALRAGSAWNSAVQGGEYD